MSTFNIADFKPDSKTPGFNESQEYIAAPPPYNGAPPTPPDSPPLSDTRRNPIRKWVGNVVRQGSISSPSAVPLQLHPVSETQGISLAGDFNHSGDVVLSTGSVGFQLDSRVLCAASSGLESIIHKRCAAASVPATTSQPLVVTLSQSAEDVRSMLSIIAPYAIPSRPSMSVETLTTIAELFDTFSMRPAARFALARVVEAHASRLDTSSMSQCIAWARLANRVQSVVVLRKAIGLSEPSALRQYWLQPADLSVALGDHVFRALVLVGNMYTLLGDQGLATVQFEYKNGTLCLTHNGGD